MNHKITGGDYEKIKHANIKPLKFLENERKKRHLIMYVDVNITPKKQGRIGIYDGDCLKDLAKNFCRTF